MWRSQQPIVLQSPKAQSIIQNWPRNHLALLTGCREIASLAHLWMLQLASSGISVCAIDCAIRFNPLVLAQEAIARQLSVEDVLRSIRVRRDFTPYQLLRTMTEIIQRGADARVYFLLSPCKQFFDGDVARDEGRYLLQLLLAQLQQLQRLAIPAIVVERASYQHPSFVEFWPQLQLACHTTWQVNRSKDGHEIQQHGPETPSIKQLSPKPPAQVA